MKNKRKNSNHEAKLDKMTRDKILQRMKAQYRRSVTKKEKSRVLDAYCAATGITRKHAIVQMHGGRGRRAESGRRGRPRVYDERVAAPLQRIWCAASYCCAELLHAGMARMVRHLTGQGQLTVSDETRRLLEQMSCATLKRWLRRFPRRRRRARRPQRERPLHARVPLSCFQPKPTAAGTFECDLVEHNGGSSAGEYIYTVHLVDVVTAWRGKRACLGKHPSRILSQLEHLCKELPYTPQKLDVDNDRAFISDMLLTWLEARGIQPTRSRPYKKNDNAHIEQKNGTDVRGLVGYRRYDTVEQCELLNRIYELDDLHVNLWIPCRKLIRRVRDDERGTWRKYYDTPRTPLERVLERPDEEVPATVKARLRALAEQFDPLRTQRMKEALLLRLLHTRSRAQQSADLIAAAHQHANTDGRTPARERTAVSDARRATPAPELGATRLRSGVALTHSNKRQVAP